MQKIALAIETTGLAPYSGARLVEFACIELDDRGEFGRVLHRRVNPEMVLSTEDEKSLGLTNEELSEQPIFSEVADELAEFIEGSELIMHNAPFALGFLDHEFSLLGKNPVSGICVGVIDIMAMAKELRPEGRYTLEALAGKLTEFLTGPVGPLRDAIFTAEVYLSLTVAR
ncbi:MAG: hypothetical protein K2P57_02625 [Burkholderiales bacterium]|nr:hypothetical protein [Burkholderiales bacterium]